MLCSLETAALLAIPFLSTLHPWHYFPWQQFPSFNFFFFFKSNYIQKSIACGRQCLVSSNPTGNRWKTTENRAWKKPSNISSCPCSDVLHTHLPMCKADLNVIFPNYSCKGTWKEFGRELWTFQSYFYFKAFWKTIQLKTFNCCFS